MTRLIALVLVLAACESQEDGGRQFDAIQQHDSSISSEGKSFDVRKDSSRDRRNDTDQCTGTPDMTAIASGLVSFTFNYYNKCPSNTPPTNGFVYNLYSHTVTPNGFNTDPIVQIGVQDTTKIVSGVSNVLEAYNDASTLQQNHQVTITEIFANRICKTPWSGGIPSPPTPGIFKITFSGKTKGSDVILEIDGYLWCTPMNEWKAFKYKMEGKTTV